METIHNDYELIYLVKYEYDEHAYKKIITKYSRMVYKMVHQLNIQFNDIEDFYQEGMMALHKAITNFNESFDKTFTRYFELILKRHLLRIKSNNPTFILLEDSNYIKDERKYEDFYDKISELKFENPIEKIIHEAFFIEKQTQDYICRTYGLTKKQVYNAVHRVKSKYKDVL